MAQSNLAEKEVAVVEVEVCKSADIPEGEITRHEINGFVPIAVARYEGNLFVFPDKCPHADESLSDGWLEDGNVVCGVHFAEFDLETGDVENRPVGCPNLSFIEFDERDGVVFAKMNEGGEHV